MMRFLSLLAISGVALTMFTAPIEAQSGKPVIAVVPVQLTEDSDADRILAAGLGGQISAALSAMKRYAVVDRTQARELDRERTTQRGEGFLESGSLAQQGKELGAQLILSSRIETLDVTSTKLDDGSLSYDATGRVSLQALDVATGEMIASGTIDLTANAGGKKTLLASIMTNHETPRAAIAAMVKNSSKPIAAFLQKNFPLSLVVVELTASAEGPTVLLAGGTDMGIRSGMRFSIIERVAQQVGDRTLMRTRELGAAVVTKVEDENFCVARLEAGGDAVAARLGEKAKLTALVKVP